MTAAGKERFAFLTRGWPGPHSLFRVQKRQNEPVFEREKGRGKKNAAEMGEGTFYLPPSACAEHWPALHDTRAEVAVASSRRSAAARPVVHLATSTAFVMSASPVPKDWDQLIAKARSGDWRAEELLFKDSKRILWATYRRNNGQWGMPEDDAESLMHLSIARAMNKYPGGYYPAYLKTTFINGVIGEWIRKRHADLEPIYIPDGETEEERPQKELAASTDVLAEVLARNEWRIVFDCMSKLPPARRESLQLSLEGWSYEQIAQRVREKSIKDLIYRAKQDVQKCFEERTGMKP